MAAEIPEEFIDLLERLSEGDLDEAGRGQLVALLKERPELRHVVTEHFAVAGALGRMGRDESGFAERTAAHVAKVAEEGTLTFARKVKGRIIRRRIGKVLAAAAVISLAALPFLKKDAVPRQEVAVLVRVDSGKGEVTGKMVRTGDRLDETSGLIRIDFNNGAVVAVEAPAKLTVISGMEIALESGRLNAWCSEAAHGFKVTTSSAALTDLGTSFGISASSNGKAEFMVLDGKVEVEKGEEKIRLTEGNAVQATDSGRLKAVPFDPSGFKNTWPLACGIVSTRGAVIPADPDIPEKLVQLEDDDNVLVLPERREVPFSLPIEAEITDPGTLPGDFDGKTRVLQPIPRMRLSSFLIRYNPVGVFSEEHFLRFEGEVTFDRPVLAIACQAAALSQGDPLFATCEWSEKYRGIELEQRLNPPDSVTLSEDRKTVKVIFYAGASTDDIRVILGDN